MVAGAEPLLGGDWDLHFALLRRRARLLIAVTVAGLVLGALFLTFAPKSYRSSADILLDPRQERVVDVQQVLSGLQVDAAAVETQVEILRSRGLADRVVATLALDAPRPGAAADVSPAMRRTLAIDRLLARLKIERIGLTDLIKVSYRDHDPARAARVANTVCDLYLAEQLDAKAAATRRASALIGERLGGLRQAVEAAENEVETYKSAHGLMAVGEGQGSTITQDAISALEARLADAEADRARADAKLSTIGRRTAGRAPDTAPDALASPLIQALRRQKAEASAHLADLEGRYGARHPEVIDAHRQLDDIDAEIDAELSRVSSALGADAEAAHRREAALTASLAGYKAELSTANVASVRLNELERNAAAVRTLYQAYLDRFRQTVSQEGMAQSDARVVSPARPPVRASFPDPLIGAPFILALSMLAGLASVWIAEIWEDGLYGLHDVERRLGLAPIGAIPRLAQGGRTGGLGAAIGAEPQSPFTDSVKALAATLGAGAHMRMRTIAVVSAEEGEGKTSTCVCLGQVLAQAGLSSVVVDCDLRRRGLGRFFERAPSVGLMEALAGAPLDQAIVRDPASGLAFLPIAGSGRMGEEALGSPAMDRLLADLRRRFDVVLLDTAPVLPVAATRVLARKADGVILIARWGRTRVGAVREAARLLAAAGAPATGVVLNQANFSGRPYVSSYYPPYQTLEASPAS